MPTACYNLILDRPAAEVWNIVRDFNSYPIWVHGVEESHIEDGLSGTAVGSVRNFAIGGARTRQRLVAHSDVDQFFSYESCSPFEVEEPDRIRTMSRYQGTLRLRTITADQHCLAEWSSTYDCPSGDAQYWAEWWAAMLPKWLDSLRDYLGAGPPASTGVRRNPFGVPDVPDPDGGDVSAFADDAVRLTGSADDDNARAWNEPTGTTPAAIEGNWSSRWNGEGFGWQRGRGALRADQDRVYILFDWDDAAQQGLIEARWDGRDRLIGRYLNLGAPEITRPWVGLIINAARIDGEHSSGRIDFRR